MGGSPDEITCKEQGRAGLVRLTRTKELNALTFGMIRALEAFSHQCANDPHVYGIVQEAEGKGFCAGGDIRLIRDLVEDRPEEAARQPRHMRLDRPLPFLTPSGGSPALTPYRSMTPAVDTAQKRD